MGFSVEYLRRLITRRSRGELPMEVVRVFDLKAKRLYRIPVAELAPGVVRANVQGIEGMV